MKHFQWLMSKEMQKVQNLTFSGRIKWKQSKEFRDFSFVRDNSFSISETKRNIPDRPWSAQEPRWHADRMFSTKQKNWEGLAKGRKHLHHGQLLPGSTESDEEQRPKKITCWSEGASPGR